jgi:ATP-dependent Clp protease ATP-binding subunit ClpC
VFERFTDRARRVLVLAQEEAGLLDHSFIGTEHILLGLVQEGEGLGARALRSLGVSPAAVRAKVEEIVGVSANSPGGPAPFTPRAKKVLELALREALQRSHSYIGTEHILLGLVQEGHGVAVTVLTSLGVDLGQVRQAVDSMTSGPEAPTVRPFEQPTGTMSQTWPPGEPSCPRCGANLSQSARFRAMDVPADSGSADPISVYVVYCLSCETTLHMLQQDGPS